MLHEIWGIDKSLEKSSDLVDPTKPDDNMVEWTTRPSHPSLQLNWGIPVGTTPEYC